MIENLNEKQIEDLKAYRDKWINIGLDTKRANRQAAEQYAKDAYRVAGLDEPKMFIWVDSPIGGLIAVKLIKEISNKYKIYKNAQVGDQVRDQVRDQVWDQVWDQVRAQVGAQVRAQVVAQVWAQVGAQVWAQVGAQVRDQVRAQVKNELNDLYFYGQCEANWLSFYDYFLNVCDIKKCEKLLPLINLSKEVGWTWFYSDVVIFTEKPTELYRNQNNQLHSFDQYAIKYNDGYGIYVINGIRVPNYICETPKDGFTKDLILKEQNADYRRCIVQKIGIEKTIELLGAEVIDSYESPVGGLYELLQIDYDGRGKRCYLKIKSKSIDAYHIEGVKPGILTVKDAICYRNGLTKFSEPEILT